MEVIVSDQASNMILGIDLEKLMAETIADRQREKTVAILTRAQVKRAAEQKAQDNRDTLESGATPTPLSQTEPDRDLGALDDTLFAEPKLTKREKRLQARTFRANNQSQNPLEVIGEPFTACYGPLRRTKRGNKFVLTIKDFTTRYPEAIPLKKLMPLLLQRLYAKFFARMEEILSDQGTNFFSATMKAVFELLHIHHIRTSPYHSQTDGMLEHFHATLKSMLRKTSPSAEEWDVFLPYVCFAYREVPHSATGFSPFELLFGRNVRGPLSIIREQWTGTKAPQSVVTFVLRLQEQLAEAATLAREAEKKTSSGRHRAVSSP